MEKFKYSFCRLLCEKSEKRSLGIKRPSSNRHVAFINSTPHEPANAILSQDPMFGGSISKLFCLKGCLLCQAQCHQVSNQRTDLTEAITCSLRTQDFSVSQENHIDNVILCWQDFHKAARQITRTRQFDHITRITLASCELSYYIQNTGAGIQVCGWTSIIVSVSAVEDSVWQRKYDCTDRHKKSDWDLIVPSKLLLQNCGVSRWPKSAFQHHWHHLGLD